MKFLLFPNDSFPRSPLVTDCRAHQSVAGCSLNIDSVKIPFILFIKGNSVFIGKSFRTFQQMFVFDVGLLESPLVMFSSHIVDVFFTLGHFHHELWPLAILVSDRGNGPMFIVRVCTIVVELVIVHNKFIVYPSIDFDLTDESSSITNFQFTSFRGFDLRIVEVSNEFFRSARKNSLNC